MEQPIDHSVPPIFWQHVLDRIDPHKPAIDTQVLAAQSLCGRWFAIRRLEQGLLLPVLAAQIGVEADTLLVLEAGVATAALLAPAKRRALCRALASEAYDSDYLESVCALALGETVIDSAYILESVIAEVDAFQVPQSAVVAAVVQEAPAPTMRERVLLQLEREPVLKAVLEVLNKQQANAYQIWQQCKHYSMGHVADALRRLEAADGIAPQSAPAGNDVDQRWYAITVYGRSALSYEQSRAEGKSPPIPSIFGPKKAIP